MFSPIGICGGAFSKKATLIPAALVLFMAAGQSAMGQPSIGGEYELYSGFGVSEGLDPYSLRTRLRLRGRFQQPGLMVYSAARVSSDLQDPEEGGEPGPIRFRLLEAFLDLYLDDLDIRIGHQLVVWGQMDGTFITDVVSPLDLTEFLAQDFADIRLAVPAARASYFADPWSVTGLLVLAPIESPVPSSTSPWFAVPDEPSSVEVTLEEDNLPAPSVGEVEPGLKLTYSGAQTSLDLIYFYGHNRIPAFAKSVSLESATDIRLVLRPEYYRRHVFGTRLSTSAVDPFVFEAEAAYESLHKVDVDAALLLKDPASVLDLQGLLVSEGQLQAGVSVSRVFGQTILKTQFLGSLLTRNDERAARDRFVEGVTLLVQTNWMREAYSARIFAYLIPGGDYWINPTVAYNAGPGLNLTLGAHVFGDEASDNTFTTSAFGLFDDNDFVYFKLTLAF